MNFDNTIKQFVEKSGADFFGIADLSLAHEAITTQGGSVMAEFPRAISIGIVRFCTRLSINCHNELNALWLSITGITATTSSISVLTRLPRG